MSSRGPASRKSWKRRRKGREDKEEWLFCVFRSLLRRLNMCCSTSDLAAVDSMAAESAALLRREHFHSSQLPGHDGRKSAVPYFLTAVKIIMITLLMTGACRILPSRGRPLCICGFAFWFIGAVRAMSFLGHQQPQFQIERARRARADVAQQVSHTAQELRSCLRQCMSYSM